MRGGENDDEDIIPEVTLENVTAENDPVTTLKVNVTPVNAEECAYLCLPEGDMQYTAEEILALGTKIIAEDASTVTVEELDYGTTYVFAVAVISKTGHTATESLTHTTGFNSISNASWANTYIVSEAGSYEFETRKVSGAPIEGIASAGWIWATKQEEDDTDQKLISDVSYENGKIKFTATGERGNVAISAFDASKKVLWTWLIWCTDQPDEMEYESGAIFLDRGIGATSADPADGTKTWSIIVYQWGRPAPIFAGYVDEWGETEVFNEARKWTIMNPEYGFEWKAEPQSTTIEGGIAAPTTFFACSTAGAADSGRWISTENRTLWGEEKTDYDPCPPGYRIPNITDWGNIANELVAAEDEKSATYTYNGKTAYFPAQCYSRSWDTGENIVGFEGFSYWNSKYSLYDPMGFLDMGFSEELIIANGLGGYYPTRIMVQFNPDSIVRDPDSVANQSFAIPVRCMRR